MKGIIADFKQFIMRGNVIDMAVGIIIGIAFGAIINSVVNDLIMPPIGILLGNVDFSNLYINMSGGTYASLAEARQAGASVVAYGVFINTIINFIIIAAVLFFIIRMFARLQRKQEAAPATVKDCPHCFTSISIKATRCPNCTSELKVA
jgi:large conductance mechanosensitive channel